MHAFEFRLEDDSQGTIRMHIPYQSYARRYTSARKIISFHKLCMQLQEERNGQCRKLQTVHLFIRIFANCYKYFYMSDSLID